MAAKLSKLFRGGGRNALDLPVAGLSALAAAFAAFAIPQDILSRAVVATGLPGILSAAQPPLGLTARVALAIGGAVLVFGIVLLALRLLDRSGLGGAEAQEDENRSGPRVRRRDGHPDAPAPRPISAARDLGEPAPPRAPRAEVPLWLDEAEPVAQPFGAAREPADKYEPEPALKPEASLPSEPVVEAEAESWQAPEPQVFPEAVPAPLAAHEPAPGLETELEFTPEAALPSWPEPEPEPEPQPVPVAVAVAAPAPAPAPEPDFAEVAAAAPASIPAAEPVVMAGLEPEPVVAAATPSAPVRQPDMPTSIAGLMERLEQGLAKRKMIEPAPALEPAPAPVAAPAPVSAPAAPQVFPDVPEVAELPAAPEPPQVFPEAPEPEEPVFEAADDRLQSAIASLQRLAARSA